MSGSVPPLGAIVWALLQPTEDAPEVFEQKMKGKMPKSKATPPKPKAYAPPKGYKHQKGYRITRQDERHDEDKPQ